MASSKVFRDLFAQLSEQSSRTARRLDQGANGWPGILAGAAKQALQPGSAIIAAAISYVALLSLFPLALLCISIASFSFGQFANQQQLLQRLEFIAPGLTQLLGQNIQAIIQARGPATGIALVGLVWSSSTIFSMLSFTMQEIWGIERSRRAWEARGLAILLVLVLAGPVLFLASLAGSLLANLLTWMPSLPLISRMSGAAWLGWGAGFLSLGLSILLDVGFFIVLYLALPHAASGWRVVLPGAIGAGLLWELAKKAFLFFIASYITMSNLVYGSLAAIIAFLAWAHLSGVIFLFGAYLNVSYHRRRSK